MENFVFKNFMNNEVIQKTILFADAFNLYIDGWRPANSPNHPYRIVFYNGGMIVGYIDTDVYQITSSKYVKTDMPLVLFTPFGKITGNFNTHYNTFSYTIENQKHVFERINGAFRVDKSSKETGEKYQIASSLTLTDLENHKTRIAFNRLLGNYTIEITKTGNKNQEAINLYLDRGYLLRIRHFNIPIPTIGEIQYMSKITVDLDIEGDKFPASFEFLDTEFSGIVPYRKEIDSKDKFLHFIPYWKKLPLIDLSIIDEEIAKNDPSMLTFIDEVRAALTLPANGITPVSIYDRIAQLCFYDEIDKYKLDFTRAKSTKTALTHNPVLKRMKEQRRKSTYHN